MRVIRKLAYLIFCCSLSVLLSINPINPVRSGGNNLSASSQIDHLSRDPLQGSPYSTQKWWFHAGHVVEHVLEGDFFRVTPISCVLFVSRQCNVDCPLCMFASTNPLLGTAGDRGFLTLEKAKSLLDKIARAGIKAVNFSGGGEPTANPDLIPIMKYAKSLNLDVGLYTNGTLLKQEQIEGLLEVEPVFIRISWDAASPQTYGLIYGIHDPKRAEKTFHLVEKSIQTLAEGIVRRGLKTTLGTTMLLSSENKHEVRRKGELLQEIVKKAGGGVGYVAFKPIIVRPDHTATCVHGVVREELPAIKEDIDKVTEMLKGRVQVIPIQYKFDSVVGDLVHTSCLGTGVELNVDVSGEVFFCCEQMGKENFKIGNLFEQSVEQIWASEERKTVWNRINAGDFSQCPVPCRYMAINKSFEVVAKTNIAALKEKIAHAVASGEKPPHINYLSLVPPQLILVALMAVVPLVALYVLSYIVRGIVEKVRQEQRILRLKKKIKAGKLAEGVTYRYQELDESLKREMRPEEAWFYLLPALKYVRENQLVPFFAHRSAEPFETLWNHMVETLKFNDSMKASPFSRKVGNIVTYSLSSQILQMIEESERNYIFSDLQWVEVSRAYQKLSREIKQHLPAEKDLRHKSREAIIEKIASVGLDQRMVLINELTKLYYLFEAKEEGLKKYWKYDVSKMKENPYVNFHISDALKDKRLRMIMEEAVLSLQGEASNKEKKKKLLKVLRITVAEIENDAQHDVRPLLASVLKGTKAASYFSKNSRVAFIEERAFLLSTAVSFEYVIKAFNPKAKVDCILIYANDVSVDVGIAKVISSMSVYLPIDVPNLYQRFYVTQKIPRSDDLGEFMAFNQMKTFFYCTDILREVQEKMNALPHVADETVYYQLTANKLIKRIENSVDPNGVLNENYLNRIFLACLREWQSQRNPNDELLKKLSAIRASDADELLRNEFELRKIPEVVDEIVKIKSFLAKHLNNPWSFFDDEYLVLTSLIQDEILLKEWIQTFRKYHEAQMASWNKVLSDRKGLPQVQAFLSTGDICAYKSLRTILIKPVTMQEWGNSVDLHCFEVAL